jgi:aconitate hydratase
MTGRLNEGVTATDLVLTVTEMLRKAKVVGKFVEFFGAGAATLTVPDRATIGNMAPEYGATMGFFAIDDKTVDYLSKTGRSAEEIDAFESYYRAQGMFGMPAEGSIDYSQTLKFDLGSVVPSLAGPKRPQDRITLPKMKDSFNTLFSKPVTDNGFNQPADKLGKRFPTGLMRGAAPAVNDNAQQLHTNGPPMDVVEMVDNRPTQDRVQVSPGKPIDIGNGDVLIAAITSCTNTSNPGVLLAAGLLAKKAAAKGLKVERHVKTSLAPGSRVVTEYLTRAGLLPELEKLNFYLAGYGCTTCIGNAGPLDPAIEETITKNDLVCAAVLSGNRNFEARIHPNIKANFLASPPLVVAFAIAGRANIDMTSEPLGTGEDGAPVFLRDIWPSTEEIGAVMQYATDPATYRRLYSDFTKDNPLWNSIPTSTGQVYAWDKSTYIAEPPFFKDFSMHPGALPTIRNARALGIFGDSVTTDHISPAGSIKPTSPAGIYLLEHDVGVPDFNSYGSRRGNHEVMMRGTFANVRIKNLMLAPKADGSRIEGGVTTLLPDNVQVPIYDAAMTYIARGTPTVILAGEEYGTGSSRDWAAKGTQLLGVKAVIARSFERIHRSNLVGMGVLPCQFKGTDSIASLKITGDEQFDISGLEGGVKPQMDVTLTIRRADGSTQTVPVLLRIDTPIEVDYYHHGGILPFVLRELLAA